MPAPQTKLDDRRPSPVTTYPEFRNLFKQRRASVLGCEC
jgi:hypothetical protein